MLLFSTIFVFISLMVSLSTTETTCSEKYNHRGIVVNCRDRKLNTVPDTINNTEEVIIFDLSLNNITHLPRGTFSNYSRLEILNLTASNVIFVDDGAFLGLDVLNTLYLTNNHDIQGHSGDIFLGCHNLTTLHTSGCPVSMRAVANLTNLERLTITPITSSVAEQIADLPKLKSLTLAFGNLNQLNQATVKPLAHSEIEELSFHACQIRGIDNGTFNNFTKLKSLSFACNDVLPFNDVINALSTSRGVRVESLVLDLVGNYLLDFYILGKDEPHGACRAAWKHIKHLSLRGSNLIGLSSEFQYCLPRIQSLALGNNVVLYCGTGWYTCSITALEILAPLLSLDVSYINVRDWQGFRHCTGCYQNDNFIPSNSQFFPPVDQAAIECHDRIVQNYTDDSVRTTNLTPNSSVQVRSSRPKTGEAVASELCFPMILPPCLSYVRTDGSVILSSMNVEVTGNCVRVGSNNLRYINMSNWCHSRPGKLMFPVYGLDHLETMDVSGLGLRDFNFSMLRGFPKLKSAFFSWNMLGTSKHNNIIPSVPRLQTLDLSCNEILTLGPETFDSDMVLTTLSLKGNLLMTIDFLSEKLRDLGDLDISDNRLVSLDNRTMQLLDVYGADITLDLTGNPLKCDCEEINFIEWFQATNVRFTNRDNVNCTQKGGNGTQPVMMTNVTSLRAKCFPPPEYKMNIGIVIGVSCGIAGGFTIVGSLLYRYRWSIKWRYYRVRYLNRHREARLLRDERKDFSAYIIYPLEDDDSRHWVREELYRRVELTWQRPVYLLGRDDLVGDTKVNNIVDGLMSSDVAVWVLCPAFLKDKCCEIAANFAVNEFGTARNMIVILNDQVAEYGRFPTSFLSLMHPSHAIPRMTYPDNEDGRNLFWARLEEFIPHRD